MSNGLNEFTSKRVDEMCVQVLWSIFFKIDTPPPPKKKCCSDFNLNCFIFTMSFLKKHKRVFLQSEREHAIVSIDPTEK